MIEVATGVAFLMSSLYGAGHVNASVPQIADAPTTMQAVGIARNFSESKQIEAYVREQFADTQILVDVARCESTFRQFGEDGTVIRGKVNKADVGVMQINEKYHAETALKLGYDIYSVEGNVAFGKYLYKKYGTSPWYSSSACWLQASTIAEK